MEKNQFYQGIRGLLIILVVMIHLPYPSVESPHFEYWLSFRQIINFPVAGFIFLAGYFVNQEKEFKIWERIKRLFFPYMIWNVFYIFFQLATGNPYGLLDILIVFMTGGAVMPLYFLMVLIQLTILTPLLINKNLGGKILKCILLAITPSYLILRYYFGFTYGIEIPYVHLFFPAWLSFYVLGLMFSKNKEIKFDVPILLLFLVITLILSMFEAFYIQRETGLVGFASSQIKLSSFLVAVVFVCLMTSLKNLSSHRTWLTQIGDYSFGIFLNHMFFLTIINKFTKYLEMPSNFFLIKQGIILIVVLACSYYSIKITERIFKDKMLKYIGFR